MGENLATVSKWCINTSQPDLTTLAKIAKALEVDLRTLINKTIDNVTTQDGKSK